LKISAGAVIRQDDMLGMFPSLYPTDSMLDMTTYAGAGGAYNLTLGSGAGVTYAKNGFNVSLLFVTPNDSAPDQTVGVFSDGMFYTAQIGYAAENWGLAGAYTGSSDYDQFGVSGYWSPSTSGFIPSISAGFGFGDIAGGVDTQSWTVGLIWSDIFYQGNDLGFAIGGEGFDTLRGLGVQPDNDDSLVVEGFYKIKATDNITVTPGIFYLDRTEKYSAAS